MRLIHHAICQPMDFPLKVRTWPMGASSPVILTGTFLVSRACARPAWRTRKGTIINIAQSTGWWACPSLYAGTALVNEAHYAAGKGGIVQLTRYLATTLAPSVRVNCIAPGGIKANNRSLSMSVITPPNTNVVAWLILRT